jgi:hypothetical protein
MDFQKVRFALRVAIFDRCPFSFARSMLCNSQCFLLE